MEVGHVARGNAGACRRKAVSGWRGSESRGASAMERRKSTCEWCSHSKDQDSISEQECAGILVYSALQGDVGV